MPKPKSKEIKQFNKWLLKFWESIPNVNDEYLYQEISEKPDSIAFEDKLLLYYAWRFIHAKAKK